MEPGSVVRQVTVRSGSDLRDEHCQEHDEEHADPGHDEPYDRLFVRFAYFEIKHLFPP